MYEQRKFFLRLNTKSRIPYHGLLIYLITWAVKLTQLPIILLLICARDNYDIMSNDIGTRSRRMRDVPKSPHKPLIQWLSQLKKDW
jgi:hypothetical protein